MLQCNKIVTDFDSTKIHLIFLRENIISYFLNVGEI